ncbi:MAG: hypothetical protein ACYDAQ_01305 [Mycobacteriales bacterium]
MIQFWFMTTLMGLLRQRLRDQRAQDRGSFTLEQAVIAAALLALAIGLTVVLVNAVANHEKTIK